jgi:hypothetical protein
VDYVGAAINRGTLGLAYCPAATPVTVELSKFVGQVQARWYDPTNGKFQRIADSPLSNTASRRFTPPGKNSAGDNDWVLVLESEKKGNNKQPPGGEGASASY